ncbi:hypothetical protein ACEWY4_007313 [Coilia grayii]|uniref:Uncharacterized protein n=1 Tax=Coilia grayii TaxID=363190 RepID=A0ABD1KGE4_9TELE
MPVVKRRKSWEEHVTCHSGPRYSYDDMDLVCCPGDRRDGPRSRRGRQKRCTSMPECYPGVPASAVENGSQQSQESEPGERESCEMSVSDVFKCESVTDNDIMADHSQKGLCSLAPSTAASANKQDGDDDEASPHPLTTLAKNPTVSETAADTPLGPTNGDSIQSCGDDLAAPEEAHSDCPTAQHPSNLIDSDTEAGLSRHPNVLVSPKTPANTAQTTVEAARPGSAQVQDNSTVTLERAATLTAWENAPAPLSCHSSGFEGSVLKADMLDHTPSLELAASESVPEQEPDAVCQEHMTGEAECCERPGKGQTDLGRPDADISAVDTTQEARGPEGLALVGVAHQVMSSSSPAAQTSSEAHSTGSSMRLADRERLQTHREALSIEPCKIATRDAASPEPLGSLECSGSMGALQERHHEGGSGGLKLDTILEVSLSEVGDETGGPEKLEQDNSKAAIQLPSQTPQETRESHGTAGRVGVEPLSSNNMTLDEGPEALQTTEGQTATCSGQLELGETGDVSSKMAAIQEEGADTVRRDPPLPISAEPTQQQDPMPEETTVKLRVRKVGHQGAEQNYTYI